MVDLNPLHYINKFNHMFGDTVAEGLEFLGINDPAVDPDGIRELAKKWRALAKGLDDAAEAARKSLADVEWEGKAAKALHKRAKSARKQATEMADSLREGAKALDDFADKAHDLLSEIGVILAEIAELELAGLALSVLTGGTSAVVSTLLAGSRAAKVVALVARIEQEGTVLASAIRGVMEVIRAVERALKTLKEIRGVAAAGKMAKEGMKFSAFDTLLRDPEAFKDPEKLAGILTEGALLGVGFGALGKALGKGLKALKPADLAKLSKGLKLNCATFERLRLNPGFNKLPASIRNEIKKFVRDPIDVATGDMVLTRTDVSLPGVLPLVLERTHLSSYRWGGWFGPSWASTLDQRVQVDDECIVYAGADGARICFPFPDPETGEAVCPETAGSRLTLAWDDDVDGALRVTDPDSGLTQVFHSPVVAGAGTAVDLPLQHIQDRNGNRVTVVYAEGDIPTEIIHSGGYHIALDHHPSLSRITGLRLLDRADPHAAPTSLLRYEYDDSGRLVGEINSSGTPMRYTYDSEGRITSWTDRNNVNYWYTYDGQGRVSATGGTGSALASTLSYDDETRTTCVTDSLGHTRAYTHNMALRLIRETNPLGAAMTQEWDESLRLVTVTDEVGLSTRYAYDVAGNLTAVTRADGNTADAEYNEHALPVTVRYPDGAVWRQEYDEKGNRTAITDPGGSVTRYEYGSFGQLTKVVDALGQVTRVRCDRSGLPEEVTDPMGSAVRYERDSFGRPVVITDALGYSTSMEWTVEGRLVRRTNPSGANETWFYDGEGNCLEHVDPQGGRTRYEYTMFDLLAARVLSDGSRYDFQYDTELRLTRVANPQGLDWTYSYDSTGLLTSETDFDGRTHAYQHDAAGRLIARTTPLGQTIRFGRDPLGRIDWKSAAGSNTTYTYDAEGRLLQAVGPDATLSLDWDENGRIVAETTNGRTLRRDYDVLGRETRRATPSGATSVFAYDPAGNRTSLTTDGGSMAFIHDTVGRETARYVGEQVSISYGWDPANRLSAQSVSVSGATLSDRRYRYRPDGHLVGLADVEHGFRRFDLDAVGHVTSIHAEGWSESYAYDSMGNVVQATWPDHHAETEARGTRAYTGTVVRTAGSVRYEHDDAGRMVLRRRVRLSRKPDTWRFSYDAEDHLTSVITPDGTTWRYLYDPLGRRIAKQRLAEDGELVTEQTDFTWDGPTLVEQTTVADDRPCSVTLSWDHTGVVPLSQNETVTHKGTQEQVDARFFTIVTDLIGTPTELLSDQGEVAWRARATLWGVTEWHREATAYTPLRFPGQYFDPETGLHYNHHRYYDPYTGRYTAPDPLGLEPAPNPVAYVHNPHTWIDYLGLAPRGPKDPLGLGKGYRGRMDTWQEGTKGTDFEIHVYDKRGREVGIFGSDGWFNKHRKSAAEVDVPRSVENALKGKAVDFMRGTGRLGDKGTMDITGDKWKRPRLAAEGVSCKG
ncbi:DUF6531 domain-containing protein [Streptomyces tendae]